LISEVWTADFALVSSGSLGWSLVQLDVFDNWVYRTMTFSLNVRREIFR